MTEFAWTPVPRTKNLKSSDFLYEGRGSRVKGHFWSGSGLDGPNLPYTGRFGDLVENRRPGHFSLRDVVSGRKWSKWSFDQSRLFEVKFWPHFGEVLGHFWSRGWGGDRLLAHAGASAEAPAGQKPGLRVVL